MYDWSKCVYLDVFMSLFRFAVLVDHFDDPHTSQHMCLLEDMDTINHCSRTHDSMQDCPDGQ